MIRAIGILALIATPALAQAQNDYTEERLDLLVSLVCEQGGSMPNSVAAEILPANGFTMAESREIVFELEDRGMVEEAGLGVLTLTEAVCASKAQ